MRIEGNAIKVIPTWEPGSEPGAGMPKLWSTTAQECLKQSGTLSAALGFVLFCFYLILV